MKIIKKLLKNAANNIRKILGYNPWGSKEDGSQ
jgi:hypothetical protein